MATNCAQMNVPTHNLMKGVASPVFCQVCMIVCVRDVHKEREQEVGGDGF